MQTAEQQQSFEAYEREMIDPLHGHDLTPLERYVASLLLDASSKKPIDNDTIRAAVRMQFDNVACDQRAIKAVIRSLRKHHEFPILASRQPPYGYWWWHGDEKEMRRFVQAFKGQALDQLHTLRMVQKHCPRLLGQLSLEEFERLIAKIGDTPQIDADERGEES